jgi:hypothetical protein
LVIAMIIPMSTNTMIAICIQIQVRDIWTDRTRASHVHLTDAAYRHHRAHARKAGTAAASDARPSYRVAIIGASGALGFELSAADSDRRAAEDGIESPR